VGTVWTLAKVVASRRKGAGLPAWDETHRVLIPALAFALLYCLALGFSQVRFMRYTLLLVPVFAAFAALWIQQWPRPITLAIAGLILAVAVVGTSNVVFPFTQTDPRDEAAQWLRSRAEAQNTGGAPLTVGLADASNPLWFHTPPLWPQDAPPGTAISLQKVQRDARFDLRPLGLSAAALQEQKTITSCGANFSGANASVCATLKKQNCAQLLANEYSIKAWQNRAPLLLPGRALVPHDFLYSNPRVEVWERKLNR
jgi:hypothetical protein